MQRSGAVGLALLLLASVAVAPTAVPAHDAGAAPASTDAGVQSDTYAGSHVTFEASGTAVTNYSVGGSPVFASVQTQSQSEYHADSSVGLGAGLSAITDVAGVDLSLDASTQTRAEIQTAGSATMTAHDSANGILTVDAGGEAQYVSVDLAADTAAEAESDQRVVVDGDRTGTFLVVGDGEVGVDDGTVTADLQENATLVFRSYAGERTEADREQEQLVVAGTATAEVYASEESGEAVADVATYGQDIAVETRTQAEGSLTMTVERATSDGTVVVASVSEAVVGSVESADDVRVTVDGQAAAQASSYSELRAGLGEEPRYMVTQSSEASASADVLVAVDHFSEREVGIQGSGNVSSGSGSDGSGDGGSSDGDGNGMPGFGIAAALLALLGGVVARIRSRG